MKTTWSALWRRICGITVREAAYELARGRAMTLYAVDVPMRLWVARGRIWVTGARLAGDVLLAAGQEVCVPRGASVVVEGLGDAGIRWVAAPRQGCPSSARTSPGWWTMAWAPASRSSDSGRKPQVAPTANMPAARAVSMSVAVSPR